MARAAGFDDDRALRIRRIARWAERFVSETNPLWEWVNADFERGIDFDFLVDGRGIDIKTVPDYGEWVIGGRYRPACLSLVVEYLGNAPLPTFEDFAMTSSVIGWVRVPDWTYGAWPVDDGQHDQLRCAYIAKESVRPLRRQQSDGETRE
jgi:hypothetical protein